MIKRIRLIEILCLGAVTTAIVCFVTYRWHPEEWGGRREVDDKGTVFIEAKGASVFAAEYRTAANLLAADKISEAEAIYNELVKKEPASPTPYGGLAACRMARDDHLGALQLYQKVLEMDPREAYALVGMGSCYALLSDYAAAIEKYEAAIALDGKMPDAHWGLVVAYAYLGKKAQARDHLDRFKQLAPDSRHIETLEAVVDGFITLPPVRPDAKGVDEDDRD
jgi:tetratricopeptide (TPR) repeat protein